MNNWKGINGFENYYQINNFSEVKALERIINWYGTTRIIKEKILKPILGKNGYYYVSLCKNGKVTKKYIHRLLAESFIPNPENKPCINHKNGIKTDNRIENLEWCSYSHNNKHAYNTGLKIASKKSIHFGEDCYNSILNEKQVLEIRSKYKPITYSQQKLANEYNVTRGCIKSIIEYKTWKHIKKVVNDY